MIKIEQILPLLKKGYVAMDSTKRWYWYKSKPEMKCYNSFAFKDGQPYAVYAGMWAPVQSIGQLEDCVSIGLLFDLAPYEGDWKDSLMECGNDKL